jgi:hypothetical protein
MDSVEHHHQTMQQRVAKKYATEADYRRPLHHSPLFWCGVVVFIAAISAFVFSDSLAWLLPRNH